MFRERFSHSRFSQYAKDLAFAVEELSREQRMADVPANSFPAPKANGMTITGAGYLAQTLKAKIEAAKARVAASTSATDTALNKLISAADSADKVSQAIEAEADDLMAQIGQFSNGAPE